MSGEITGIEVQSGVSVFDGKPFVQIDLSLNAGRKSTRPRHKLTQVRPEKAREIGMMLIEAAIEAERDAALVAGGKELGLDRKGAAQLMALIRDHRARRDDG